MLGSHVDMENKTDYTDTAQQDTKDRQTHAEYKVGTVTWRV